MANAHKLFTKLHQRWPCQAALMASCLAVQGTAGAQDDLDALFAEPAVTDQGEHASSPETITLAEEALPDKPVPPTSAVALEEIIVTAQKREQRLSDVPISVSAVSGEKLADAGIENLMDLGDYAPGFKLVDEGLNPLIYMRGVGSGTNQGFEMSVGVFNDGIHLARPFLTMPAFLDVERVEVLRGPQSILFGKNAIAGALNIAAAKPTDYFSSTLRSSWFWPDADKELGGHVSGPLGENLAARIAFRWRDEDGYMRNLGQQRDEVQLKEQALRASIAYTPTDWLDLDLKLERGERQRLGRSWQLIEAGILNQSHGSTVGLDDVRDTNFPDSTQVDTNNVTLTGGLDLGDHRLEFVSGLLGYDLVDAYDADSTGVDSIDLDAVGDYTQWTQEVRWVSAPGEHLDFVLGGYYHGSEEAYHEVATLRLRSGTVALVGAPAESIDILAQAGPANLVEVTSADMDRLFETTMDAWSAFGQTTWHISPVWRLNLGLRFVSEKKRGSRVVNLYQVDTQDEVDPATAAAFSQLLIEKHALAGRRRSDSLLPSISLQHDLNEDIMLYGSYSEGAKSGGYDARNNNAQDGPTGGATGFEYDDELADSIELGGKLRLLAGAAELNLALYRMEYTDMQVSVFDGVAGFAVTNAGSARVQGLEIDSRWLLSESILLSAALAYLDFEWLRYDTGPCHFGKEPEDNGFCNFAGKENQQTPKWSGSLSASYLGRMGSDWDWSATVDVNFRDEHYVLGDLDPRSLQQAYAKINARLALMAVDDTWSLALVGKNLSDELTTTIGGKPALDTGGYHAASERPRSYGLELRYHFE